MRNILNSKSITPSNPLLPSTTTSTTAPIPDATQATKNNSIPPTEETFLKPVPKAMFTNPPRVLVIGAGSRGTAYAASAITSTNAIIAAVVEPIHYKRREFGRKFIWHNESPQPHQEFEDWRTWVKYEESRRKRAAVGEKLEDGEERGIDAVFVCVLDELHEEVVVAIAGLEVHICCEKPMSTRLESCVNMYRALKNQGEMAANGKLRLLNPKEFADRNLTSGHVNGHMTGGINGTNGGIGRKETIFGICHVLRYSAHNLMLRHLVLDKDIIGDVLSIEHVEPVGWWHFSHSYVRYVRKIPEH